MARKTSKHGITLIEQREGIRLKVYRDSKGLPTVGVGHLIVKGDNLKVGDRITQEQCDAFLAADLGDAENAVNSTVRVPLSQNQFDALVSFIVNIGANGFKRSTVLRRLNAKDYDGAAKAMMMWLKPPEITGRRRTEVKQFLAPDPQVSATTPASNGEQSAPAPLDEPTDSPQVAPLPIVSPPVEVATVSAEPQDKVDTTISKWSARFVAIPTALLTFVGGLWSTITSSPVEITLTLIIAGTVIAGSYFLVKMIINSRDKARADAIQADREQRAHEIQKLTIEAAMRPDLNTVKLVNPPNTTLLNSDVPEDAVNS